MTTQILKGIGKKNGDGWKDVTKVGEVVFVWNTEMPEPYKEGQYPRIGNRSGWTAGIDQYDFTPATPEDAREFIEAMLSENDQRKQDPEHTPCEKEERKVLEAAAKAVYHLFDGAESHPWVEGGNSNKQVDARRFARAALQAVTPSRFPERDAQKPAEAQGLFRKFEVRRIDGSDLPGGKHYGCRYFVLDLSHDPHVRAAMRAYADSCASTYPELAADIRSEFGDTEPESHYA